MILILINGCTARISQIKDYGDIQNYGRSFINKELLIGLSVEMTPDDPNALMNSPFKSKKLLVINIKMKNIGRSQVVINRENIAIFTEDGKSFIPLDKESAARRASGPFGIYQVLFLSNIGRGYHKFGLDRQIVLGPGEEKKGYLFYKVKDKYYDLAKDGEIRILFAEVNMVENIEYKIKLGK